MYHCEQNFQERSRVLNTIGTRSTAIIALAASDIKKVRRHSVATQGTWLLAGERGHEVEMVRVVGELTKRSAKVTKEPT
jgi:hypothetical protein